MIDLYELKLCAVNIQPPHHSTYNFFYLLLLPRFFMQKELFSNFKRKGLHTACMGINIHFYLFCRDDGII